MDHDRHPGLRKYRAAKAERKAAAIKAIKDEPIKAEIRTSVVALHPDWSPTQVEAVVEASFKAKAAGTRKVIKTEKKKGKK